MSVDPARFRTGKLLVCLLAISVSACTATIERKRKSDVHARIVGSDSRGLIIEDSDGVRRRVPGAEIEDIDHPGNVLMVVGMVFAGLALAAADSQNPRDRAESEGLAVIGLGFIVGGAIPYFRSTGAAEAFTPDDSSASRLPEAEEAAPVRPKAKPKAPAKPSKKKRSPVP